MTSNKVECKRSTVAADVDVSAIAAGGAGNMAAAASVTAHSRVRSGFE